MRDAGKRRRPLQAAGWVAAISLVVATVGIFRTHGGDWTGPFLIGESGAAAQWPVPVHIHPDSEGYDGQFFLALTFDPFLRTPLTASLDDAEYRAHRVAWPVAAWMLGAGNYTARIAALYLLLLGGFALLAFLLADWAARRGASAWWGVVGALGLGSLVCLQRMLGDALMTLLLVATATVLARKAERGIAAATILFTLAVLQKETAALALPLLALPLLRSPRRASLLWLALPLAVVGGWWGYVEAAVASAGPFSLAIPFSAPGQGFATAFAEAMGRTSDPLRRAKDAAFLGLHAAAVLLGLMIGGGELVEALRRKAADGLALTVGLFALLGACLSSAVWIEPWAYARVLLPLLTLELMLALDRLPASPDGRQYRLAVAIAIASCGFGLLFTLRNLVAAVP